MSADPERGAIGEGNAAVIRALLAELESLGVREFCICAGARNAPLLDALTRQRSDITFRSFYEERSAAFFALGRVMRTRRPVAVVTTSGTAVAELLPAVIEAHYQGLPLVMVTADRPSRYRGSGAPQAIEQRDIFRAYVLREVELEAGRLVGDVVNERQSGFNNQKGPIHFNVCLEEGLQNVPLDRQYRSDRLPAEQANLTEAHLAAWREFWEAPGEMVVLAGNIHPEDVPEAREFLLKLRIPIVAEATSNLCGEEILKPFLLSGGEQTLKRMRVQRLLRLGGVPSWRWWRDVDDNAEMRVLNVSRAAFRGLARTQLVSTVPWEMLTASDIGFNTGIEAARPPAGDALERLLEAYPRSEPAWMRHLSRLIGDGAAVFLGNSLPIREWNLAAVTPTPGTRFFANRGANGIDGLVSTWFGLGAGEKESWLIAGDLSALYDLGAPWILPQLARAKRRIVVVNNGGGKIFSRVSWLKEATEETKRFMENPHAISFEHWARLWGMDYQLHVNPEDVRDDAAACSVWEVRPDPEQTEGFWQEWQKQS